VDEETKMQGTPSSHYILRHGAISKFAHYLQMTISALKILLQVGFHWIFLPSSKREEVDQRMGQRLRISRK
jgi:hypothetical protein